MRVILILLILIFPALGVADVLVGKKSDGSLFLAKSGGATAMGDVKKDAVSNGIDPALITELWMTAAEFKTFQDSQYASNIPAAITKRLSEIKSEAIERFKGYELYSDFQSVIDYKAAIRAVPTTAATEMAALPDVASVKNYQPTWPAKPNL